ncbi:hypothetical protein Y032_0083g1636 [Ancylostoma ceylanicum]|uniref:Uncharacterized protein n=1 Tax=Ancylostoma ceylanicum TaxID=53326 RepID=A0A016TR17_9BILA|nr:hypothetical protein Y032_0083g1636 [Ancylostoma ceylanicum]
MANEDGKPSTVCVARDFLPVIPSFQSTLCFILLRITANDHLVSSEQLSRGEISDRTLITPQFPRNPVVKCSSCTPLHLSNRLNVAAFNGRPVPRLPWPEIEQRTADDPTTQLFTQRARPIFVRFS